MPTEVTLLRGSEKGATRMVEDGIARSLENRGMAKITGGFLFELRKKQMGNGDGKVAPPKIEKEVVVEEEVAVEVEAKAMDAPVVNRMVDSPPNKKAKRKTR